MIIARLFTVPELFSNTHVHWLAREEGGGGGGDWGSEQKSKKRTKGQLFYLLKLPGLVGFVPKCCFVSYLWRPLTPLPPSLSPGHKCAPYP